ncbi:hypothetical protein J1N35_011258 [Gossypium stocksii]|uniref:Uncharacterized protein n=1 Tax=Gossypium stocksii TaxID=47602 RepID=A0A9D4AD91_9ROSI|nr:hypothetical protein J1N35_011258 [Gossypium stocksii]
MSQIEDLNSYILAWKAKYKDTQTKCTHVEGENNMLKARKSYWKEKHKAQEQRQLAELEGLHQSSEEALRKYQDTRKNLKEALPKLRSNLVLHAQVAAGHLNLS